MSLLPDPVRQLLARIKGRLDFDSARERLSPRTDQAPNLFHTTSRTTHEQVARNWQRLHSAMSGQKIEAAETQLFDSVTQKSASTYSGNIENFIGCARIPVGIAGPLRVNGLNASGDYLVPLATSEAALVASYSRGARVATKAGGISAALLYEGVIRTPAFVFDDLLAAGAFVDCVATHAEDLKAVAERTTRYGKLCSLEPVIDANVVFLRCRYTTGDAAGQNMVTIATEALCRDLIEKCPVTPKRWYVEGNFSGDKKASFLGFLTGRGRKVTASVVLPTKLIPRQLGVTVDDMLAYAEIANLGARLSGQIGAQGHFANGLAALYLATGQDVACVAESAIGSTRMEQHPDGLFMSVTLPNILVGSVGGGTGLPTQTAALNLLGLKGAGCADALAEVVAATCLAGEISIMAAIAGGDFARAHQKLARG
ncbi:MAG: hydroxymethylglutaryl-CoA reductase [Pseudomonadota bacterium]